MQYFEEVNELDDRDQCDWFPTTADILVQKFIRIWEINAGINSNNSFN